MKITDTKTGSVKELNWDVPRYHFQKKVVIKVDDLLVKKVKQIFGTDKLKFDTFAKSHAAKWYRFVVEVGIKQPLGTNLHVVFAKPDINNEDFIQRNYRIVDFVSNDASNASPSLKKAEKPITGSITIFVNPDNPFYRDNERALIYMAFVDEHDNFLDPDNISVILNLFKTGQAPEKKKVGTYTFVTPPLGKGNNQITIVAQKDAYNIEPAYINITVLPEIPTAWYQP